MSPLVIEGVLTDDGFVQTNGTSFMDLLAERERLARLAALEEAAQVADDLVRIFQKGGSHISNLAAQDVAAAIRKCGSSVPKGES